MESSITHETEQCSVNYANHKMESSIAHEMEQYTINHANHKKPDPLRPYLDRLDKEREEAAEKHYLRGHLYDRLLDISGEYASVPEDLRLKEVWRLLHCGTLTKGNGAVYEPSLPRQCHFNAAMNWLNNRGTWKIGYGYALTETKIWVEHSWNIRPDGILVEPTTPFELYYGYIRSTEECFDEVRQFIPELEELQECSPDYVPELKQMEPGKQ